MGVLKDAGVDVVHHYTPLHYLPFIGRDRALLCKPSLQARGFAVTHLRSKSRTHDVARGFGQYAFLTLEQEPQILMAKLQGGFPHIGIAVPADAVEATTFDLCRYNVAMTRYLRRGGSPGFPASESNGRYYGDQQIPVARTLSDQRALLKRHLNKDMIEVLIHGDLPLPEQTRIQVYSSPDQVLAHSVLDALDVPWEVDFLDPPGPYDRKAQYAEKVDAFIENALDDPDWQGNGLEFDRV
jgi:hypothetical protein